MELAPLGRLIGVSLGPGDPTLITRRAWTQLHTPAHWCYPVSQAGGDSYALDILRRAALPIPATAQPLHFPMTRDPATLATAWTAAAVQCLAHLHHGRDVLFLVEGDASTYSTFSHLARTVRALDAAVICEVIPGITSFHAAAAQLTTPLVEQEQTLVIAAATAALPALEQWLDNADTLVLLKIKPVFAQVTAVLARRELLTRATLIERVGTPHERLVRDLTTLHDADVAYLSLLLVLR